MDARPDAAGAGAGAGAAAGAGAPRIDDDTLALLAKFGGEAAAPIKARAELAGVDGTGPVAAIDGIISVSDLLAVLGAFSGDEYPFGP